jgi:RNA polymerase sigma-70 factor (ECF subfamily)
MTGSIQDVEDLVQETYVRAWRAFEQFEGRSSIRTWLYRIATNVCLTFLGRSRRRMLPSGLVPASADPYAPPLPASSDVSWLEPVLDSLVVDNSTDPAVVIAARQSVRLALVAAAQTLPPRQRAAFFLCDVLDQSTQEAAETLDISVPALKSLLQRARARLDTETVFDEQLAQPTDPRARAVLDLYMTAFENSDIAVIEQLLADDAVLEMTGTTTWFAGKATCAPFIANQAIGQAGVWQMHPLEINGQLGAAAYLADEDGSYHPYGIAVLTTSASHLHRISLFADPTLLNRFELGPSRQAGENHACEAP